MSFTISEADPNLNPGIKKSYANQHIFLARIADRSCAPDWELRSKDVDSNHMPVIFLPRMDSKKNQQATLSQGYSNLQWLRRHLWR